MTPGPIDEITLPSTVTEASLTRWRMMRIFEIWIRPTFGCVRLRDCSRHTNYLVIRTRTALTLLHAVSKRGLWAGSAVVALHFVHTALFEHTSLFLGGTHCHATSAILPMVQTHVGPSCSVVASYTVWVA